MSERTVHAVVVAYHAPEPLERCLAALEARLPVTVVDNSSSRDVHEVVSRHGARYIDAGANRGFAAGVNTALRELAGGSADVLLLNPDAELHPDGVEALADFLQQHERVAAVAPRIVDAAGDDQRVMWPFPTPLRACFEAVGLGRLRPRADFAIGAVLLLRSEAIREVGLFDERFFLYAEEADWQRRARNLGWTSSLCPVAVARHAGAGTSVDAVRREELFHAAQETYIRKWYGTGGWWVYRVAAVLGATARAVVLARERRTEARRRALLYLRGPRRVAALGAE